MKIHFILNCFWPNGTAMSGGDKRFVEFFKIWQNDDRFGFKLYTTKGFSEILKREGITNIPIELIEKNSIKGNSNIIINYLKRTINCILLKKNICNGDVVYSTTDIMPDVIPGFFLKRKYKNNIKWVVIVHHIVESYRTRPGNKLVNYISEKQQRFSLWLTKKYADKVLIESPLVYDWMKQKRWNMDKIQWTSNGVDVELLEPVVPSEQKYDACFLGRLNNSKGIMELPHIWKKVVKELPNAKLGIIGSGTSEMTEKLKNEIFKCKMEDNIDMLGFVETLETYAIMKASKVFLFTSHEEGWGIAIAEAMACGLPVVAYNLPVYKHIFKSGIIECSFKNIDEMAENTIALLKNESRAIEIGGSGEMYVKQNYQWKSVAEKELNLLVSW